MSQPGDRYFGGTFAWDGQNYYFANVGGTSGGLDYLVFDASGALTSTETATGNGNLNGPYFDWGVGRYSSHDGFGNRSLGNIYIGASGNSDSHCFSPPSPYHSNSQ